MTRIMMAILLACSCLPGVLKAADDVGPRPRVHVQRSGTFLRMDFVSAQDGRGNSLRSVGSVENPRFEVFKDEQRIGGGRFAYG
ncbi:MAG: hypothetical protein JW818_03190 [Pirellulales bacterium]|nr:hypothetical protein [Pirellulales bacterium]